MIREYVLLQNRKGKVLLAYPAILNIDKNDGFRKYKFNDEDLLSAEKYFHEVNNN